MTGPWWEPEARELPDVCERCGEEALTTLGDVGELCAPCHAELAEEPVDMTRACDQCGAHSWPSWASCPCGRACVGQTHDCDPATVQMNSSDMDDLEENDGSTGPSQ